MAQERILVVDDEKLIRWSIRSRLQDEGYDPEELLYDKYQMGRDIIGRFEKEPPYAWIIPQDQWDAPTAHSYRHINSVYTIWREGQQWLR